MSLADCIKDFVKSGDISETRAQELIDATRDIPEQEVIDAALSQNWLKKRQNALQAEKTLAAIENAQAHPKGFAQGVLGQIVRDKFRVSEGVPNIDATSHALSSRYNSIIADFLGEYHTTMLGFKQDKEGLHNFVRAIFGEKVGDAAAEAGAKAVRKGLEVARVDFNKAGGAIAKLDTYNLPQTHDYSKVSKAAVTEDQLIKARDDWTSKITELIEPLKDSDGIQVSPGRQTELLHEMFESIRTQGANKVSPGQFHGIGKVANKGTQHRVLHFKDADSWIKYQEEFGNPDIFGTVVGHLERMASDTAAMQVWGPNPQLTMQVLSDMTKTMPKYADTAKGYFAREGIASTFRVQTGLGGTEQSIKMASYAGATRSWLTSSLLGGAFWSSLPDTAINGFTAQWAGTPAMKSMGQMLRQFATGTKQDKIALTRMGLAVEIFRSNAVSGIGRFGEIPAKGWGTKFAEATMRGTLMTRLNDANRNGFAIEFAGHVADQLDAKVKYNDLDPNFLRTFKHYGITEADWGKLGQVETVDYQGAKHVIGNNIADVDEQLFIKYMGMIQQEGAVATTAPDARIRSMTSANQQTGTLVGEAVRTGLLFKTFPVGMLNTHLTKALGEGGIKGGAWAAGLFISLTTLGALVVQAKDMLKGKEPQDITDPALLGRAVLQGGGLGIIGDLLGNDPRKFNTSITGVLTGPAGQLANDLVKFTVGNTFASFDPDGESKVMADAADLFGKYSPVGNQWPMALAADRLIFERLQIMADPAQKRKFRKMMRRQRKETGQDYWWKRGEMTPGR